MGNIFAFGCKKPQICAIFIKISIHFWVQEKQCIIMLVKNPQPFHDQKDKFLDALASLAPTPPLLHTLFTLLVSLDSQRAIVEHEILTPRMCDSRSCFVMIYIDLW